MIIFVCLDITLENDQNSMSPWEFGAYEPILETKLIRALQISKCRGVDFVSKLAHLSQNTLWVQ